MPSKIRVLPEEVINKIAAGEVVEGPSSVIKELVDNSIDANATEIKVEIKGGGRQLIRVADNGCGMNADDAVLCLERHATSKVKSIEDIYSIHSRGFRGEALPSIASISKFSLETCEQGSKNGTLVLVDGGKMIKSCPIIKETGTTIEVKSLFFNVPVRKKFQKSPAHDAYEIQKMITALALANPQVAFIFISNEKTIIDTKAIGKGCFAEAIRPRVADILGEDFLQQCVQIKSLRNEYRMEGFIGTPIHHRPNRSSQHLFINHRPVSSPLISYAVKEGYSSSLPSQRHPIFALYLTIPPEYVDINVHPQKKEVRLRHEILIRDWITKSIQEELVREGTSFWGQQSEILPWEDLKPFIPPVEDISMAPAQSLSKVDKQEIFASVPWPSTSLFTQKDFLEKPTKESAKKIPQILSTISNYILTDDFLEKQPNNGFCFIDQRAAQARILFEKYLQQFAAKQMEVQELMIPLFFKASSLDYGLIQQNHSTFESFGLHFQKENETQLIIRAIPAFLKVDEIIPFIQEVLEEIRFQQEEKSIKSKIEGKFATRAYRNTIAINKKLTLYEAQEMLKQLIDCKSPYFCPQGKPIIAILQASEIENLFKR